MSRETWLRAAYLLSVLARLAGGAHTPSDGERGTLHQIMHDMQEIWPTQALQALVREWDQRLGPVADQRPPTGPQGQESLIPHGLPRRLGAVFCHVFQQQRARAQVHKDQYHLFQ